MSATKIMQFALGAACLGALACQRADPGVTRDRARAEAEARAARTVSADRAARYYAHDRAGGWQPVGGPAAQALPPAPPRTFVDLLDDINSEISGILADRVSPGALSARIRDELLAEPGLRGGVHELEVDTNGMRVILRGWVRSQADRMEAADRARFIAGDDFVDNQLEIRDD